MEIVRALVGTAVLLLGRHLFWLFVAVAGFLLGWNAATEFLPANQPDWVVILVAVVVGLIGAVLAVFLQAVAVGVAGFVVGGYILLGLLDFAGFEAGNLTWLAFLVGGIIGAVLVLAVFDWALIFLSSLIGANLIVETLALESPLRIVVFLVLVLVGIAVQAATLRRYPERRRVIRIRRRATAD
ncbi:MAG: hypothetical protein L0332_28880 [Chloroflexi bacterium]|nr:hypothetical protein [Chloroflexota bacterium]MCI0576618.1 hypothetical protein [Chloroflexota bacterium]MCI0647014.1 hypothetical protein [Chloroflexota bacterium]MCI0730714.1 hypothetical protein [Chloroflexota bacterium]